jgi:hypothetical protein
MYAALHRERLSRADAGGRARADSVLGVECEEEMVALAAALAGGPDAAPVPPDDPGAARLHRLPFMVPDRDDLPALDRYARLLVGDERRVAGHVEATRGCKYHCRHCPIPPVYGGRFFAVPVDVVLEDARRQVAAGARHITFGDPDFLNSAKHALAVARGLHAAHPEVTFSFTAKIEHIVGARPDPPGFFVELAALGCVFIVSAVESLSDHILALLDKGHTAADVMQALAIVRGAGISLRPTFVAFTPFTALSDYLALCRFIREQDLEQEVDPIQLAIRLLIPPGSLLLARPELAPHLVELDEDALTHRWRHPDPRMDQLATQVMELVEQSTHAGEPPHATFARIHALAAGLAGEPAPALSLKRRRPAPPRLSEPWFCCAEPTALQLGKTTPRS